MRSESCSFIWHPKVRTGTRLASSQAIYQGYLAYSTARSLPHDRDPDLARVLQLLLDLLGDVAGQDLGGQIVDVRRL